MLILRRAEGLSTACRFRCRQDVPGVQVLLDDAWGESATPIDDADNNRITAVSGFLGKTHLNEIPQLWSILRGDMRVVGPRAVWTEEEHLLENEAET